MTMVKIVKVTKVKPDYQPAGKKWCIRSRLIQAEVDGQKIDQAEIKTFDAKLADKLVAGYSFECDLDERSKANGYDHVYTTSKGAAPIGSPDPAAAPSPQAKQSSGSFTPRNEVSIMAQTSLKCATEILSSANSSIQQPTAVDVTNVAEVFLDWIKVKSGIKVEVKEEKAQEGDNLPY